MGMDMYKYEVSSIYRDLDYGDDSCQEIFGQTRERLVRNGFSPELFFLDYHFKDSVKEALEKVHGEVVAWDFTDLNQKSTSWMKFKDGFIHNVSLNDLTYIEEKTGEELWNIYHTDSSKNGLYYRKPFRSVEEQPEDGSFSINNYGGLTQDEATLVQTILKRHQGYFFKEDMDEYLKLVPFFNPNVFDEFKIIEEGLVVQFCW